MAKSIALAVGAATEFVIESFKTGYNAPRAASISSPQNRAKHRSRGVYRMATRRTVECHEELAKCWYGFGLELCGCVRDGER
jgi:hypothetical protein